MKYAVVVALTLICCQFSFAQDEVARNRKNPPESLGHDINSPSNKSQETLLEPEISRTERAERMKKILQEVRKDLQTRGQKSKEEKVD